MRIGGGLDACTLVWTEESTAVQFRLAGAVERYGRISSGALPQPAAGSRSPALHGSSPRVLGADEAIVRGRTDYADRVAFAVVHHTAGRSPSSPEESAAIIRAIQTYHVKGNGWNDIGYNALVDAFSQVFEGAGAVSTATW
jgi:hypothetical protein